MKTVGKILKRARQEKGCRIADASKTLKIHPKFLKALETGNYEIFAHPIHIKGFLKNYAGFLDLDVPQVLAFWRREYKNTARQTPIYNVTKPLKEPKLVVTPGVLTALTTLILVVSFLGYLFWQYRSIAGPPPLNITAPKKDVIVSDPQIIIKGESDPQAHLELNGQKILIDENGTFSLEYVLSDGTNTLTFTAENEFGKSTEIVRRAVYERPEALMPPTSEASTSATLEQAPSASPSATGLDAP